MEELSDARPFSWRDHWLLVPVLVLATLLRLWQINESLWLDELHTAWVVADGVGPIVERAQIGNQSPLYFYLPWATTSLFGMSEWALRLPSLVAGVGLVLLAYAIVLEFTRSRFAAIACAILASTDHNFLFYATEARPYACVQLLAAVQLLLLLFWRLQSSDSMRCRLGFVGASVVLFYLHYTAMLLLGGQIVFSLWVACYSSQRRRRWGYPFRKLAVDLLCIGVAIIPTLTHVFDIGSRKGTWSSFVNNTSLMLPVHWFSLVSYVAVPVVIGVIVGVIRVAITLRRDEPLTLDAVWRANSNCEPEVAPLGSSRRTATVLLVLWLGVPLATVWLLTLTKMVPLYLGRYVIGAALAPVLFAGLCIGVWKHQRSQWFMASVVVTYALYSSGMIEQFRYDGRLFSDRAENWRDAVRYVNDNEDSGVASPVFVRSGLLEADQLATDSSELLRVYCVLPIASIYQIDRPAQETRPLTTHDAGRLSADDVKLIESSGGAWFIVNGDTATRERCARRTLESMEKEIQVATGVKTQLGFVVDERQFGRVGVFGVLLYTLDDQVIPLDDQPTSPNSIAPP